MLVVILGPPASGKGTQARKVAQRYGITHLSTGALLRQEVDGGTEIGREVEATLARGDLVDDATVCALLGKRLAEAATGWVLDGFPRTMAQATSLDESLDEQLDGRGVDALCVLDVPAAELMRRVTGRARRESRDDDSAETLRRRIEVYEEQTRPILAHYDPRGVVHHIEGARSPGRVTDQISSVLDRLASPA